jgi:hypothetical protein
VGLSIYLWSVFFPRPERIIRKRLTELSKRVSFKANEPPLAAMANASKLADFFTRDIQIKVDVPGGSAQVINGREELFEIAHRVRLMGGSLDAQFFDINVTVASDKKSAEANLTLRAKVPGDRDQIIQELKLLLNKSEGNWRIQRLETIKTLSLNKVYKPIFLNARFYKGSGLFAAIR